MPAAPPPARYVSVSELYATDEVELLLDEIRDLEPTSCRGEDVQDFEIAGSGVGGGGGGGRSPAGTELTERSWDSHAQYSRAPPPCPRRLAPVYCRLRALRNPRAALQLVLVCVCVSACGCVWSVAGVRLWRLPLAARWRLLALAALSSAMLHCALVALELTRLAALLPLDWPAVRMAGFVWSGVSLGAGGALSLHAVLAAREYRHAAPAQARALAAAAALALLGAGTAAALGAAAARRWLRRRPPAPRAAYRAVPTAAPPHPQPSTSRERDPPL